MKNENFMSGHVKGLEDIEHTKAKTSAIKHSNILNWILVLSGVCLGSIIIIIAVVLFLKNPDNANYLFLMLLGVFLLTGTKPSIEKILSKINE